MVEERSILVEAGPTRTSGRYGSVVIFTLGFEIRDLAGVLALLHAPDERNRVSDRKLFWEQLRATRARGRLTMNGWDLFTWFNSAMLAGAAVAIFLLFLKDASGILSGRGRERDSGQGDAQPGADPDRS